MEIAKDEIFNITYNTGVDRIIIKKKRKIHRLIGLIKKHKFITSVITTFTLFSMLNFYMIYSFIKILQNI